MQDSGTLATRLRYLLHVLLDLARYRELRGVRVVCEETVMYDGKNGSVFAFRCNIFGLLSKTFPELGICAETWRRSAPRGGL